MLVKKPFFSEYGLGEYFFKNDKQLKASVIAVLSGNVGSLRKDLFEK